MSLEQQIEELKAALVENTSILKQLVAGQKAAIEVVKAGNPATATRGRGKKATEATQNTSDAPADTESGAEDAGNASETVTETKTPETTAADAPKEKATFAVAAKKWMDKVNPKTAGDNADADEYKRRGPKVMAILAHFGAAKASELPEESEDKAMFFLRRTVKGLPVNFDAAYDFDGPFDQPEPEAAEAPAADDDDDMFG